jgi:putative glutamine amidotransferase
MTMSSPEQRPRIGITAEERAADDSIILPEEYVESILRAGGEPVPIAPWLGSPEEHMRGLDALILGGGGDLDPARYASSGHAEIYDVDPQRDAGEFAMLKIALEAGMPVFGICRGAQLLNVALGGTLYEHLPDHFTGPLRHRADPPGATPHPVRLDPTSRLAGLLETESVATASWHHQGLRDIAPTLRAVAWAPDGLVEAIEHESTPWLFAVQWHPEQTAANDPVQQRLFDRFVAEAGARRRSALRDAPPVAALPSP